MAIPWVPSKGAVPGLQALAAGGVDIVNNTVFGTMLEDNFMSSMIKADGELMGFFSRPTAATLGVMVIALWAVPILRYLYKAIRSRH